MSNELEKKKIKRIHEHEVELNGLREPSYRYCPGQGYYCCNATSWPTATWGGKAYISCTTAH